MFSVKDINALKKQKDNVKKETFRVILKQFTNKIKNIVQRGGSDAVLRIPEFVMGYPPIDIVFGTKYLARQLVRLGYRVNVPFHGTIHVTWKSSKGSSRSQTVEPPPLQLSWEGQDEDLTSLMSLKTTAKKIRQKK
jgi:hypothetical protein